LTPWRPVARREPAGLVGDDRLVCAWLPVCHTCSPTRGVIGCCGWRARSQACRTGHDHLLSILWSASLFYWRCWCTYFMLLYHPYAFLFLFGLELFLQGGRIKDSISGKRLVLVVPLQAWPKSFREGLQISSIFYP
jgi:hypothetical protein